MTRESAQQNAINEIVKAWSDEGPNPSYHAAQMEHLRQHWPVLYFALARLSAIEHIPPNDWALIFGGSHGHQGVPRHERQRY